MATETLPGTDALTRALVLTPAGGIGPRPALATSIQANPGVYAFLVGSGVSSAASIPTGWQVVEDLIAQIARTQDIDLEAEDIRPLEWWASVGATLRYDTLLQALAPTPAARQGLLRKYFDPLPDQPDLRSPTIAHKALAMLCVKGYVRVIVTTNFDRLIEQALAAVGVTPQVIDSPSAARTMTPLVHSPVTVFKVHGDYLATNLRNTPEELGSYPDELNDLLRQIFDEYGLVVIGWSGEHDVALAASVGDARDRRYPMYSGTRGGHLSDAAQRIVGRRGTYVVPLASADEFLDDLTAQVDRLDGWNAPTAVHRSTSRGHLSRPQHGARRVEQSTASDDSGLCVH